MKLLQYPDSQFDSQGGERGRIRADEMYSYLPRNPTVNYSVDIGG